MKIIKSKILSRFPGIVHGVSTKIGLNRGEPFFFNTSLTVGDKADIVLENRKTLFNELGVPNAVLQAQTHSGNVTVVSESCMLQDNDALITKERNLALCISIADCTPILLFDKKNKVIAGVHSGWRGTEKRILHKTLIKLFEEF
ncbi:MAG: laccase domain-containing protein, partial [Bacteroidetes bacterium]